MKLVSLMFVGLIGLVSFDAWGRGKAELDTLENKQEVDGTQGWELRNAWGATEFRACSDAKTFGADDGCVYGCEEGTNGKWAMIAQEVYEHGAKFCLTYVYVDRASMTTFERPQTKYKSASVEPKPECVWLCQDGWTGEKCATFVDADAQITCDPTPFKKTNYTNLVAGSSVENKIVMFSSYDYDCTDTMFEKKSSTKNQEHDLVLGVSGWLTDGHGAWVEPMTVRAWCPKGTWKEQTKVCKIIIDRRSVYSDSDDARKLVCINGYRPNDDETDCVPIDNTACASVTECKGWPADQFADTTKYMRWVTDGCYEYRCLLGYGFKQGTRECIECVDTETQTATYLDATGECVFTDVSVTPLVSDDGTLETVQREQATRTDLSTAADATNGKPCWMTSETSGEYKRCIKKVN